MTPLLARTIALIPTPPPDIDPSTGKGPEWGKAAPIGLLVILLLCIAMFFLMRSMNRKIKAVPASFDPPVAEELAGSGSAPLSGPSQEVEGSTDPDAEPGSAGLLNDRSG